MSNTDKAKQVVKDNVKTRTRVCRALQDKIREELDLLDLLIQIKKKQVA